jgi:hypothetical protein
MIYFSGELESAGFVVVPVEIKRKNHVEIAIGKKVVWSSELTLFQTCNLPFKINFDNV